MGPILLQQQLVYLGRSFNIPVASKTSRSTSSSKLDVKHDTNLFVNTPSVISLLCSFVVVWCDNIGLVSLILLGWELRVISLYYVYKASRSCLS